MSQPGRLASLIVTIPSILLSNRNDGGHDLTAIKAEGASGSSALHHTVSRDVFLRILPLVIGDAVSRLIKPWTAKCRSWVKQRRTHCEQMSSGLPLKADIAQCSRHVSNVIVSMTIPFASILIGAVLLRHARWKEIVLVSSLGSATGGNRRLVLALKSGWSIRKRWRSSWRKATGLSSSPSPP